MLMSEGIYRQAEQRMWSSVGASPSEQRVHLPRIGTSVRGQEVGEGTPILFVHGASNSGTSWANLAPRLDGFRCLLLDRPGCGLSDPLPEPFEDVAALERFSDALLVDVLNALDLQKSHIVRNLVRRLHRLANGRRTS